VSTTVQVEPGQVRLTQLRASILGGTLTADWRADFSGAQPSYSGNGQLQQASLAQISDCMRDDWATGTLDTSFHIVFSGWTAGELQKSAGGSLNFHWRDGMLRHLVLGHVQSTTRKDARYKPVMTTTPLRIRDFQGRATL